MRRPTVNTDPETREDARLAIADLLGRALKADVTALLDADPSAALRGERLRAEAERLRAMLPTLPE